MAPEKRRCALHGAARDGRLKVTLGEGRRPAKRAERSTSACIWLDICLNSDDAHSVPGRMADPQRPRAIPQDIATRRDTDGNAECPGAMTHPSSLAVAHIAFAGHAPLPPPPSRSPASPRTPPRPERHIRQAHHDRDLPLPTRFPRGRSQPVVLPASTYRASNMCSASLRTSNPPKIRRWVRDARYVSADVSRRRYVFPTQPHAWLKGPAFKKRAVIRPTLWRSRAPTRKDPLSRAFWAAQSPTQTARSVACICTVSAIYGPCNMRCLRGPPP